MKSLIDNEIPELPELKINPKKQLEIAESSHSLCLSRSEQPKSRGVADLWQKSEMSKKRQSAVIIEGAMLEHDYTDYFIKCRNETLNQISNPTNNLIIRLDKLINDYCQQFNEGTRRDFERRIVPWSDNSAAIECSVCQAKFSLTRRKHHCRLCGRIICTNCSKFLSYESAKKLTCIDLPENVFDEIEKNDLDLGRRLSLSTRPIKTMKTKTEKIGTLVMNSLAGSSGLSMQPNDSFQAPAKSSTGCLRICGVCKSMLDRREESMELRTANSVFVDIYHKLFELLLQIANLISSYTRMANTLNNGQTIYTLESAVELHKKIVSIQREVLYLSERIENWGLVEDPIVKRKPTIREMMLQKNIRTFSIDTLNSVSSGLPQLPTEEKYNELKEQYEERMRVIEIQNHHSQSQNSQNLFRSFPSNPVLNSLFTERRTQSNSLSSPTLEGGSQNLWSHRTPFQHNSSYNGDQGWAPSAPESKPSNNPFDDPSMELHPLQQQYLNIQSFLKQAAQSGRLNDIEILEKNLSEMRLELQCNNLSIPNPIL